MLFYDLKTVAERLMDSNNVRDCFGEVDHKSSLYGSFLINEGLAFAGYYINGSKTSKSFHSKLVESLGIIGGLNLQDDERISISAFFHLFPHHLRPKYYKTVDLWLVGCLVHASTLPFELLRLLESCSNQDFCLESHNELEEVVRKFPTCLVNVLWNLGEEGQADMNEPVLVVHGLKNLMDANHVAKQLSLKLPTHNRITICRPQAIGSISNFKVEGNYAVSSQRFTLRFG